MSKFDKLNKEEKDALLDLVINAVDDIGVVLAHPCFCAFNDDDEMGEQLNEINRLAEMAATILDAMKEGGEEE